MSDERFARQYRFGLPPEFPLASSCTSIVHHLSGPNICAQARIFHPKNQSLLVRNKMLSHNRFLCAQEFATLRLAHTLDSLVRVSRRVGWQGHYCVRTPKGRGSGLSNKNTTFCGRTSKSEHHPQPIHDNPILWNPKTETGTMQAWNLKRSHGKPHAKDMPFAFS